MIGSPSGISLKQPSFEFERSVHIILVKFPKTCSRSNVSSSFNSVGDLKSTIVFTWIESSNMLISLSDASLNLPMRYSLPGKIGLLHGLLRSLAFLILSRGKLRSTQRALVCSKKSSSSGVFLSISILLRSKLGSSLALSSVVVHGDRRA